jgi:hypothetical protein
LNFKTASEIFFFPVLLYGDEKPLENSTYGTIFPNKGIFRKITTITSEETTNKKVTKGTENIGLNTFTDNKRTPDTPVRT